MSALICGSVAYDTIMVFPGRFRDHIMPDKMHILNLSFLVPQMRREFGGVAGNIAYNLKLLGGEPLPMATVGQDAEPYLERLDQLGISRRHIRVVDDQFTPQAFITTDVDDNQISAFHPGAMALSGEASVPTDEGIRLGMISPNDPGAMQTHSRQFVEAGIPYIFDPGQAMPAFDGEPLRRFIDDAHMVIVNDYESQMLEEKTGLSTSDIASKVEAYIVTLGGDGSVIHTREGSERIETNKVTEVVDPTGCGDAYRAGLIHGILNDIDLPTSCRIGSLLGGIKIRHMGPQGHHVELADFRQLFRDTYGYDFG